MTIEGSEIRSTAAAESGNFSLKSLKNSVLRSLTSIAVILVLFYLSLIMTSQPVNSQEMEIIDRAINILEEKGFDREVFLLRSVTAFRNSDNWLNALTLSENAFAATNRPFPVITIYPDFYNKAQDDTERAMVLLHEAQHVQNKDEQQAYEYVWLNRRKLGWTILSHGTSPTFIAVELQTREFSPEIFSCPEKFWSDCTEDQRTTGAAVARNSF
jgi:hypothetical protein